ncbi:protein-tyrosine phosphatase [Methylobacterium sp. 174MFSha1.1]|uniref:tyrosine-protein phosphatase n=1 Tax=Methylobacterium sp. 174MFSha1.1 TaxID=1502749 RepID=UPI0008EE2DE1|nr:CpsB/CapC family capsule biosynthesis tyrosine phosphatase [Methylobacterium sp. 174MFSha1.1]SFU47132.1 protein-tyrosine phosphatase [Methylobacterium sp. 174MFSha1.1]
MIDLHCHLLPGIDDGPATLSEALDLARMAAGQGITTIACTPHILPGVYDNEGPAIRAAVGRMQAALDEAGLPLRLVAGADLHISPDNVARLRSGEALALDGSRYVLIELPHVILPPRMDHALFDILSAGYVPILTHPERTGWIERDYAFVGRLARSGVAMQITAGAFTGAFGRRARYWAERMLDEGLVDLVASDAHDAVRRPPLLAEAREAVRLRAGADCTRRIFEAVPEAILADRALPEASRRAPDRRSPDTHSSSLGGLLVRARSLLTRSPRETRHAGHH